MKKIILLSWSESNMAGDDWTWVISLTIRKNGTYSIGARQSSTDGPNYKLPSIYPLRRGRQVREAIEEIFEDDSLSCEEINWDEIQQVLAMHTPSLAQEIGQTFVEDNIIEKEQERQEEERKRLEKSINEWVNKANWPRSTFSHSITNAMDNARIRKIVFTYVQSYFAIHGLLPMGRHALTESFSVQFPEK